MSENLNCFQGHTLIAVYLLKEQNYILWIALSGEIGVRTTKPIAYPKLYFCMVFVVRYEAQLCVTPNKHQNG